MGCMAKTNMDTLSSIFTEEEILKKIEKLGNQEILFRMRMPTSKSYDIYGKINCADPTAPKRVTIFKSSKLYTPIKSKLKEKIQKTRKELNGYINEEKEIFVEDCSFDSINAAAAFIYCQNATGPGSGYAQYYIDSEWVDSDEAKKRGYKIGQQEKKDKKQTQKSEVSIDSGNVKGAKVDISLNQILYGPPGTGKTYNSVVYAVAICDMEQYGDKPVETLQQQIKDKKTTYDKVFERYNELKNEGRIEFITFHQSYGYEEFIQGIKPSVDKGQVVYNVEDGIFKKFCDKANKDKNNNYVFIIDEINRGNVSKIFGELITLIEESKRIGAKEEMQAVLPYRDENNEKVLFGVPNNVYILGTMNTADRSLVQLDAALRRRFRFEEMMPDYGLLEANAEDRINVQKLLREINKKIRETVDREHQIGHSYLIGVKTKEKLEEVFKNEIIPLLQEYFYEDYENIKVVLGGQEFTNEEQKIDLTNFSFKRIYGENEQ